MLWLIGVLMILCSTPVDVSFDQTVRPILEKRCQPCHFEGGKMHAKLPFDRADTIVKLGTKKLFTRIRDEHDRDVIRKFLAERDAK